MTCGLPSESAHIECVSYVVVFRDVVVAAFYAIAGLVTQGCWHSAADAAERTTFEWRGLAPPSCSAGDPRKLAATATVADFPARLWATLDHRLGPPDVSFEAKRFRHGAVAIPVIPVGNVVAAGPRQ